MIAWQDADVFAHLEIIGADGATKNVFGVLFGGRWRVVGGRGCDGDGIRVFWDWIGTGAFVSCDLLALLLPTFRFRPVGAGTCELHIRNLVVLSLSELDDRNGVQHRPRDSLCPALARPSVHHPWTVSLRMAMGSDRSCDDDD